MISIFCFVLCFQEAKVTCVFIYNLKNLSESSAMVAESWVFYTVEFTVFWMVIFKLSDKPYSINLCLFIQSCTKWWLYSLSFYLCTFLFLFLKQVLTIYFKLTSDIWQPLPTQKKYKFYFWMFIMIFNIFSSLF